MDTGPWRARKMVSSGGVDDGEATYHVECGAASPSATHGDSFFSFFAVMKNKETLYVAEYRRQEQCERASVAWPGLRQLVIGAN